jgi:hypothetical protein
MIEKHYTITELSEQLNMSFERTRQLVKDEPGVLRFAPESATGNHRSRTGVPTQRRKIGPASEGSEPLLLRRGNRHGDHGSNARLSTAALVIR